jgi:hypothetical protein
MMMIISRSTTAAMVIRDSHLLELGSSLHIVLSFIMVSSTPVLFCVMFGLWIVDFDLEGDAGETEGGYVCDDSSFHA